MLEVAEPEAAIEVRDAHQLLDALDLTDARVRGADDQEAVQQVVDVGLLRRGHGNGAPALHALVVVAQGERHPHVPARFLGGGARVGIAVRDIDRALDPDLEGMRRLDLRHRAVEEPPELRHPLDRHAETAREHVEPAADSRLHGLGALRRDPDGRVRPLDGLREHGGLGELEEFPVVAEGLAAERLEDDVDRLLPSPARAVQLEPQPLELVVLVAPPEPDVDAPPGEEIEGRDLFGDHERVVEGNHDDGRAHAEPRRLRRDVRRHLRGPREIAVRREVVLREPDIAVAESFCGLRDVRRPRVHLLRRARGGRLHEQERSEVEHGVPRYCGRPPAGGPAGASAGARAGAPAGGPAGAPADAGERAGALTSTLVPCWSRGCPSTTTFSPGLRPEAMTLSLPWDRFTTTRRVSAVESGLTTKTYCPCGPVCTAWDGTTMASGSTVSVSVTLENCPGQSRFSGLEKVALSRTVPVAGSMALSTKVTTPRSAFCSPVGTASTCSVPACMYF